MADISKFMDVHGVYSDIVVICGYTPTKGRFRQFFLPHLLSHPPQEQGASRDVFIAWRFEGNQTHPLGKSPNPHGTQPGKKRMGKSPCLVGKTISMAMFNSYVKL